MEYTNKIQSEEEYIKLKDNLETKIYFVLIIYLVIIYIIITLIIEIFPGLLEDSIIIIVFIITFSLTFLLTKLYYTYNYKISIYTLLIIICSLIIYSFLLWLFTDFKSRIDTHLSIQE